MASTKTKKGTSKAEKIQKTADTGLPPNPVDDLTDHSVSASDIAKSVDGKAGAQAKSIDKLAATAEADAADIEAAKADDNSLTGKIRKSELFLVHNHVTGENYVGISPQNDPNATTAEKRLSAVYALDGVPPRTGMIVKPKDGQAFTVGEGFGPDSTPADWARVTSEGKPLFG